MPRELPPSATKGGTQKPRGKMDRSFLLAATPAATLWQSAAQSERGGGLGAPSTGTPPPAAVSDTGMRTGTDPVTNTPFLRITVRNADGKVVPSFALDDWLRYGEIGLAFAEAVHATGGEAAAVQRNIAGLRPFLTWLDTDSISGPPTQLAGLNSDILLRYRAHLDGFKDSNGKPLADNSKRTYLGKLRLALKWLMTAAPDRWAPKLAPNLRLPQGIWKGLAKRTVPRDTIAADQLLLIFNAAAREVERTIKHFEQSSALTENGRQHLHGFVKQDTKFGDLSLALAAVKEWYGGYLCCYQAAKQQHPSLASAIQYTHGATAFFRHLYPGARELVPFVILLAVHTAYNPDTILGIRLHQVTVNDLFPDQFGFNLPPRHNSRAAEVLAGGGLGRVRTAATKGRAKGKAQHRSFRVDPDDKLGVYLLLRFLTDITASIRPYAIRGHGDRVFLFHQIRGKRPVRSFGIDKRSISSDGTWVTSLGSFISDNRLAPFALSSIRNAMADTAEQLTGDIRAVQLLLSHTGTDVTFQHYLSAGARRRAAETLGAAQGMRQRWVETARKRDSREAGQGDTLMAATPGFHCLDPYDSPIPGQTPGKMCSAWLACAFCPLAAIYEGDGHALARLIQLEDHVQRARESVAPDRYQAAYVPLLVKLGDWLERFNPEARQVALTVSYLKPLPELE